MVLRPRVCLDSALKLPGIETGFYWQSSMIPVSSLHWLVWWQGYCLWHYIAIVNLELHLDMWFQLSNLTPCFCSCHLLGIDWELVDQNIIWCRIGLLWVGLLFTFPKEADLLVFASCGVMLLYTLAADLPATVVAEPEKVPVENKNVSWSHWS